MNKNLSDEQLDRLMRGLIAETGADDSTIDDVAASPKLWWGVQREINETKAADAKPWFSAFGRWLTIGIPVLASIALIVGIFTFRSTDVAETGGAQQNVSAVVPGVVPTDVTEPAPPSNIYVPATYPRPEFAAKKKSTQIVRRKNELPAVRNGAVAEKPKAEIKTDFIALSYARDPESGQVVRVKVPSSMLVTLGLVSSVEKPSNLVDAEVIVGDDGLTRAIRFIR